MIDQHLNPELHNISAIERVLLSVAVRVHVAQRRGKRTELLGIGDRAGTKSLVREQIGSRGIGISKR
jgi:hypothetical protein